MALGTVQWFDPEKGFGFIAPDDGSAEVFVRYTAIEGRGFRKLVESQKVEFETALIGKDLHATAVRAVEEAPLPNQGQ
ncbi:cold-shock protein [Segniliparus rugosus]|uniref:CSD domain-containing protein n=1 Tax=Segniliparus rugosus (strain ATCC BAA-974 / DSM 45345 / CCUG 50838 / CIP 108380 / JCM 13579 / CDC 945) TaxID=679197 RepID=E5XTS3_SEGRC|nr:cold-shock protein [Segniliparus rugosus]EFV12276.1 hypothetical protein HMPREF9336_02895 [Segniliparus rugosus ATCC BAA-974]